MCHIKGPTHHAFQFFVLVECFIKIYKRCSKSFHHRYGNISICRTSNKPPNHIFPLMELRHPHLIALSVMEENWTLKRNLNCLIRCTHVPRPKAKSFYQDQAIQTNRNHRIVLWVNFKQPQGRVHTFDLIIWCNVNIFLGHRTRLGLVVNICLHAPYVPQRYNRKNRYL